MNRYLVTLWTAVWAVTGVIYAIRHHGVPVWMFALAAAYAVAASVFRDRWRGKYLDLKQRRATLPSRPPYRLHPVDDETREYPPVRDGDPPWPG